MIESLSRKIEGIKMEHAPQSTDTIDIQALQAIHNQIKRSPELSGLSGAELEVKAKSIISGDSDEVSPVFSTLCGKQPDLKRYNTGERSDPNIHLPLHWEPFFKERDEEKVKWYLTNPCGRAALQERYDAFITTLRSQRVRGELIDGGLKSEASFQARVESDRVRQTVDIARCRIVKDSLYDIDGCSGLTVKGGALESQFPLISCVSTLHRFFYRDGVSRPFLGMNLGFDLGDSTTAEMQLITRRGFVVGAITHPFMKGAPVVALSPEEQDLLGQLAWGANCLDLLEFQESISEMYGLG